MDVDKYNYHIGCRVCRKVINNCSVNLFECTIPDIQITYREALQYVTGEIVEQDDGLPERLCSDCGARLCISFYFKKDTLASSEILRSYRDYEKDENEMYEVCDLQDIPEEDDKDFEIEDGGEDNAVSFLTGFLFKAEQETTEIIKIKKVDSIKAENDGFDNVNRKHVCNVCAKRFQKRSNLIDHLRLHANVKIYSCEFCEKSFVQAGNYKAHIRTHTKEKPFACPYCPKAYSQSSSLKIHIRSHTQEKNYICETCEKGFTNASDLSKHKLIHEPTKKFCCESCNKHFTQKIHLRKHLEKHHPDKYYEYVLNADNMKSEKQTKTEIIISEEVDSS